jgi:ATP synthase I chain
VTDAPLAIGAPEQQIARDIAKRALWVAPLLLAVCAAFWGWDGFISCAFGMLVVVCNFLLSAFLITVTARISVGLMMGAALFGYLLRLGLIFLAFVAVRDMAWFHRMAFGLTIIVTHLGLLLWETKFVSASLAFPGLAPGPRSTRKNL